MYTISLHETLTVSAPTIEDAYRLFRACDGSPDDARRMGVLKDNRSELYPAHVLANKIATEFVGCAGIDADTAFLTFESVEGHCTSSLKVPVRSPEMVKHYRGMIIELLTARLTKVIEVERTK